jgi:Fur family transcriptional regulator, zinc uptake regulator
MVTFAAHALEKFKQQGLKITKPRRLVIELLEKASKPVSAYEIKALLDAQEQSVDTVSVYRILNFLEKAGLIHRVLSTGKVTKCRLSVDACCDWDHEHNCHHLFICKACGDVQEVRCPETIRLLHHLTQLKNLVVTGHNIELTGFCTACA